MRIVQIAYLGSDNALGGVSEVVCNLSHEFNKAGAKSVIVATANGTFVNNKNIYFFNKLSSFKSFINEYRPNIVVFHSIYEIKQIPYSNYLYKRGVPYVLVFHGGASCDNAKKHRIRKKIANCLFFNNYVRRADTVVYLNTNERSKSVFRSINDSYAIIPNGVTMPDTVQKSYTGIITISFVSRLDYYGKGLDILLPVIERLMKEGWRDKLHFEFYGNPDKKVLAKLKNIEKIASYKGFVKGEEKKYAFENADIIILPSRSEGMPMTLLESLSYGKPCIVTEMTNMADLFVDNKCGWKIDLNEKSIYETIIYAYYDYIKHRKDYFDRCISLANKYEWRNVAKASLDLYNSILRKQ
jgi:glycosyltransferase involved in cell wall biosynthesis